jgi:hypothetical protein
MRLSIVPETITSGEKGTAVREVLSDVIQERSTQNMARQFSQSTAAAVNRNLIRQYASHDLLEFSCPYWWELVQGRR